MNEYKINIVDTNSIFTIQKEKTSDVPYYYVEKYSYGVDDSDDSLLVIESDMNTCELLGINCLQSDIFIESPAVFDDYFYDVDIKEKPKASFIPPKISNDLNGGSISDFTIYFSKDMLKLILEDGEASMVYTDGRISLYYDSDYNLLSFVIRDLTEEEYNSLCSKKKSNRSR